MAQAPGAVALPTSTPTTQAPQQPLIDPGPDRHTTTPSHSDDPDEAVLAAARAEAAAEDAGGANPAPAAPAQPAAAPGATQQPAAPAARQPAPIMVPKSRLDEVTRRNRQLEEEVRYLQGVADARKAMTTGMPQGPGVTLPVPGQAQPTGPTPQEQIAQHEAAIMAAAVQFDNGEITMAQFEAVRTAENGKIVRLREQALLSVMPRQAQPQPGIADQDIMARHLQQMNQEHPWVTVLSDAELQFLAGIARQEATGLGKPIGTGPVETIRLRQAIAELSDTYGPRWYPDRTPPIPARQAPPAPQPTPPRQQQQPAPRQLSPQAQAGARKIEMAGQQPPNIHHAGGSGNSGDLITDEQVANMTTDEIEALPPQIRARILSG